MRINVVGSSGAGKSRLAATLARKLHCSHIELDALHWGPHWTEAPLGDFRAEVAALVQHEAWVIDGNYGSKIRDILWARATTVVWLDYPLSLVLWRLVRRSLQRLLTRKKLWNGNRETLWGQFFAKDALIRYAVNTHQRRRVQMQHAMADAIYGHIDFVQLSSPAATEAWLAQLSDQG